jgi:hypothetical protein
LGDGLFVADLECTLRALARLFHAERFAAWSLCDGKRSACQEVLDNSCI